MKPNRSKFTDQAWFLNCAVVLESAQTTEQLMATILEIERQMGRQRIQPKGPRIIDIDILLSGEEIIDTPTLTVPHPAMHQRRFVLEPLAEIAPRLMHPKIKRTIQELLDALPKGQIVRAPAAWANDQPNDDQRLTTVLRQDDPAASILRAQPRLLHSQETGKTETRRAPAISDVPWCAHAPAAPETPALSAHRNPAGSNNRHASARPRDTPSPWSQSQPQSLRCASLVSGCS